MVWQHNTLLTRTRNRKTASFGQTSPAVEWEVAKNTLWSEKTRHLTEVTHEVSVFLTVRLKSQLVIDQLVFRAFYARQAVLSLHAINLSVCLHSPAPFIHKSDGICPYLQPGIILTMGHWPLGFPYYRGDCPQSHEVFFQLQPLSSPMHDSWGASDRPHSISEAAVDHQRFYTGTSSSGGLGLNVCAD